jgi:hypothetical protein
MFKIRDDLEIQAASMRSRLLLEPFDERLRNVLDRQGRHMGLLSGGSIVIPFWILAGSSRNGQAGADRKLWDSSLVVREAYLVESSFTILQKLSPVSELPNDLVE